MTLEEFKKAVSRLEDAVRQEKNEFVRDSVIQRFEFCVELAWKALWLKAIDMRNLSSHTYKEDLAEQVYAFACAFIPSLKALLSQLERK